MKAILTTLLILGSLSYGLTQNINWKAANQNQTNLIYLNLGYDFGMVTQIGYGKKIKTFRPMFLTADYAFPMGNNLGDDLKVRLGGQLSVFEKDYFVVAAGLRAVVRRHQTSLVSMIGLGSELGLLAGYYKPNWHLALSLGFDKSITTHLRHSELLKDYNPNLADGWFNSSGGHFFYGIQCSKTMGEKFELSLKIGAINAQSKDENPLLPYHAQLGCVYKFGTGRT